MVKKKKQKTKAAYKRTKPVPPDLTGRALTGAVIAAGLCILGNKTGAPYFYDLGLLIAVCSLVILAVPLVKKWYRHRKYQKSSLSDIDRMTGHEFEEYLCDFFKSRGFTACNVGENGHDYGCDLLLRRGADCIAVQAKRYTPKKAVGLHALQEALGAKEYYKCNRAMVVTSSYFTKAAKQMADRCNIELIDRNRLDDYLKGRKTYEKAKSPV